MLEYAGLSCRFSERDLLRKSFILNVMFVGEKEGLVWQLTQVSVIGDLRKESWKADQSHSLEEDHEAGSQIFFAWYF